MSDNQRANMTNVKMTHFKTALEMKREELAEAIRAQSHELAIRDGASELMDRLQSMKQRDDAVAAIERLSRILSEVEAALRATAEGSYGECAHCGELINLKRLETVPWASRCVRCQESIERRQAAHAADPNWSPHFYRNRQAA